MDSLTRWRDELLAQGYSPRTVQLRPYVVLLFARHADVAPGELTTQHVLDYLRERDVAPRTRASYLTALQQWSAYVGRPDITEGIRRPRAPRTKPRPVSEAALSRMLLAADPRHPVYAWVVVGAYAGTRSAESATLAAETLHEHLTGQALRIVGKGGQERLVPAAQVVVEALEPWMALARGRGRLWPTASADSVQSAVRRLAEEAGVRCSSHQLRHRFGTQLFRHTRDLLLVQQLMGHASPSTTAIYVEIAQDAGLEAVAGLPGADRLVGEVG